MRGERRTARNWGARLSAPDEPLTLDEMRTYAAMSSADRLLESLTVLQDVQARLQRLEMFVEEQVPGYADHKARIEHLKALETEEQH